jgi:hypothetical protein
MPDDDVYNSDGFQTGPNGGVFADPGAQLTDPQDFESWDWKQIKAAVVGYAATTADNIPSNTSFSDPNSLRLASVTFNRARAGLESLGNNIRLQAEALAGPDGAWQGDAADAFRVMMNSLSLRPSRSTAVRASAPTTCPTSCGRAATTCSGPRKR